jgi:hypothetical protein
MAKHVVKSAEQTDKKAYVEPELKKAQMLQDVTQGVTPVVTGAPVG